jgi:hypothetical protein
MPSGVIPHVLRWFGNPNDAIPAGDSPHGKSPVTLAAKNAYEVPIIVAQSQPKQVRVDKRYWNSTISSLESSGMQHRVVTLKLTDVSEVRAASIMAQIMEEIRTSEASVNFNVTTRRYIPEDSKLYTRRGENLKSHQIILLGQNSSSSMALRPVFGPWPPQTSSSTTEASVEVSKQIEF